MFQKFLAILAAVLGLSGCGTPNVAIVHDQAYNPIPRITEEVMRRGGFLAGFKVQVSGMAPSQLHVIDERVEVLKQQCVNGVEKEDRRTALRRNTHVSRRYKSFYAVGHGIEEQLVLTDLHITIVCNLPKRK